MNTNTGEREFYRGVVTIYGYQRGLLYRDGTLLRVLEAGRYRLWPWSRHRIQLVDLRRQLARIANQKLLTRDQVPIGLNLVADYEITDVALATHRVQDADGQLYEDVQLAARNVIASVDVNTLLENRTEINARILEAVVPLASSYGIGVLNVGIKDVMLAPKIRDLLLKEVEAKRLAQATLIGAREEVAALRALANAAQLIEKNPALLRLRELDMARSFAANGSNTLVMGVREGVPMVKTNGTSSSPVEAETEADNE